MQYVELLKTVLKDTLITLYQALWFSILLSSGTPAQQETKKNEYTLDSIPDVMPREIVDHTRKGENCVSPQCGDTMTGIGVEVTRKLKMKQAKPAF